MAQNVFLRKYSFFYFIILKYLVALIFTSCTYFLQYLTDIIFYFSIDANQSKQLGKFVNDDRQTNCKMEHLISDTNHHLCLFATRDIPAHHQLLYDYGDSYYRWRVCLSFSIILVSQCYCLIIITWSTYTLIEWLHFTW